MNINIDIDVVRLPCSILSLDVQDVMGTHYVNLHGSLTKYRLDQNGKIIGEEQYARAKDIPITERKDAHAGHGHDEVLPDYEFVKSQYKNKEGCRIKGYFMVNKVPGNFHISSHAYGPILQRLFSEGNFDFDVGHKINHISFGDDKDLKYINSKFGDTGVLKPLDNLSKAEPRKKMYEYYLKVCTSYLYNF